LHNINQSFETVALRDQGHDARLIAAKFVKPYRKSSKNDYRDAEAIAEAVSRKNMRFVPIKADEQLDLQGLHRVRLSSTINARAYFVRMYITSYRSVIGCSRAEKAVSGYRFWCNRIGLRL
jgi:hypothetical protein